MENIWFTIIAAVILMAFALLCLSFGLLLSGKKLKRGCGLRPGEKEGKDSNCSLCGSHKRCDQEEDENDNSH